MTDSYVASARFRPEPTSAPQVKPLEWREHPADQFCRAFWLALGFGGHYVIEDRHTGDFDMWLPEQTSGTRFATLEDGKAAAQTDYEARILSCLVGSGRNLADATKKETP